MGKKEDLCDPLNIGARKEGRHSRLLAIGLGMRLGDWIYRTGGRGKDLQLAYLLRWPAQPTSSQGMPAGVWGRDNGMGKGGRKLEERV